MKIEIGAYEAKTKLPELLRQVQAGREFTITNRGKAVADLVPSGKRQQRDKVAAVDRFRTFMRNHPIRGSASIKALIGEGRE
jgi:prevent-host-death family protein